MQSFVRNRFSVRHGVVSLIIKERVLLSRLLCDFILLYRQKRFENKIHQVFLSIVLYLESYNMQEYAASAVQRWSCTF